MDKVIKDLKKKFLTPTANKYYDKNSPAVTIQEIEMMYHHAIGISALIEVEEYDMEMEETVVETIKDEFMSAENYFKKYLETHDIEFLKFMREEIDHGKKPLLEWNATAVDPQDKAEVASLLKWHEKLLLNYENAKKV